MTIRSRISKLIILWFLFGLGMYITGGASDLHEAMHAGFRFAAAIGAVSYIVGSRVL